MKTCSKCKIEKTLNCFCKQSDKKDGYSYNCNDCKKKWRQENKQYISDLGKQYRTNNEDKVKTNNKKWRENNKRYILDKENDRQRNKIKNDPTFKLRKTVSRTVLIYLKKNNSDKNGESITKYLSYTFQDLRDHLESQFDFHMSWENHGKYWHIDHIYPQSKLPYTSMEDENFKKCWDLNNLRPLEKIANIKKGNKIS